MPHTQHRGGGPQFGLAHLTERFGRSERRVGDLSDFTARGADQACTYPFACRLCKHTAHQLLIVRVGKNPQHGQIVALLCPARRLGFVFVLVFC